MKSIKNSCIVSALLLTTLFCGMPFANAQDMDTDTTLAESYFKKASVFQDSAQYDSAISYYDKAGMRYENHGLWLKYLNTKTKEGECYQKQRKYARAIKTIKPAIKKTTQQTGKNDTIVGAAYHTLGLQYYYQSKHDNALLYWKKALKIKKALLGEKHTDVADSYNGIGIVYYRNSEYNKALEYFQKSLDIFKKKLGKTHLKLAGTYNNIGIIYKAQSKYKKALEYYQKSLEIKLELLGKKHPRVAASYNNIGNIYRKKSKYGKALRNYQKSLEIDLKLQGKKNPDVASTYNNIGIIYRNTSEYNKALEYYRKSLDIFLKKLGKTHPKVAMSYNNIGEVYRKKSEYDKALEYYQKSLEIRLEVFEEKHTDVASSYNNIGEVYRNKSEYDKAVEYYQKSLELRLEELGEKHPRVATSYNNIGTIYAEKSECDKALEYYQKSLDIFIEKFGEKHPRVAASYNNIGDVYADKSEYGKALEYYHLGMAANLRDFTDTKDITKVPKMTDFIVHTRLLQSLQKKARILADSSLDLSGVAELTNIPNRQKLALQHYRTCDNLITKARREISNKSDKLALGETANAIYTESVNLCLDMAETCAPDSADYYKQMAFRFAEKTKAAVLSEALAGAEAMKFTGIPDSLLKKEKDLKTDIAHYKNVLAKQSDSAKNQKFRNKLFSANRSYDALISTFENQYPRYHNLKYRQSGVSVKQLQNSLSRNTALMSYLKSDSSLTVFLITPKHMKVTRTQKADDYRRLIERFRMLLTPPQNKQKSKYITVAHRLYRQLFPMELPGNIHNLVIIPDGKMALIPFEPLITDKNIKKPNDFSQYPYLIKQYNISYSYSADLYHQNATKEAEESSRHDWLALAPVFSEKTGVTSLRTREMLSNLDSISNDSLNTRGKLLDGQQISSLPGTEEEVKNVFKQFKRKDKKALVKLHEKASEEYVKSGELKKYKFLHFASHGIVNTQKPELSGIVLAQDSTSQEDGILHTGEIYNLTLNADLTILSACRTGIGKVREGEGLMGLTRALLYAGSKNTIVSLWKVVDVSTKKLMVDFYTNVLERKALSQSYTEALRQAKLKMISNGTYANPFFWSPFILVGK